MSVDLVTLAVGLTTQGGAQAERDFNTFRTGARNAETATGGLRDSLGKLGDQFKGLTSVVGLFTGAVAGISIAAVFKKGVEAVDEYRQSVIQTAAMISSLQTGDVAENYRKAKEYAEGLQNTLQQVDANTTLNLSSLQAITEEMVKQGVVLDTGNQKQVDAFTTLANATAVYSRNGSNEIQLRQEVSALLRGEVDMNSQLASLVQKNVDGPLKVQVEKWKQSGTLVEELAQRLGGFNLASGDLSKTWGAVKSSLETSVNLVLRAGFGTIVNDLVKDLGKANEYLKTHKDQIGEDIKKGWEERPFNSLAGTGKYSRQPSSGAGSFPDF